MSEKTPQLITLLYTSPSCILLQHYRGCWSLLSHCFSPQWSLSPLQPTAPKVHHWHRHWPVCCSDQTPAGSTHQESPTPRIQHHRMILQLWRRHQYKTFTCSSRETSHCIRIWRYWPMEQEATRSTMRTTQLCLENRVAWTFSTGTPFTWNEMIVITCFRTNASQDRLYKW